MSAVALLCDKLFDGVSDRLADSRSGKNIANIRANTVDDVFSVTNNLQVESSDK